MEPIERIDLKRLGQKIKATRESKNISQEELGQMVGKSKPSISKYESGIIESVDINLVTKIAAALNVHPKELLEWNDDNHTLDEKDSDILDALKNDPQVRMVAKIHGNLTEAGKKDLLKYAELLRNQRDKGWDD